ASVEFQLLHPRPLQKQKAYHWRSFTPACNHTIWPLLSGGLLLRRSHKSDPPPKSDSTGSGFFVSKLGHVVTNQHVVDKCKSVTVGDNANNQVTARVLETDRRNDLALLRISSMQMASAETKTLIRKLGIKVVPLATNGLMRSEDVELGDGQ
ncbi:MAG: S1C family serine protease, partial [Rhodospirillales bacterium]|nr:S1C family serine protease [Rhodospirillales bacterium]